MNYCTALEKARSQHSDFDQLPSFDDCPFPWNVDVLPETLKLYRPIPKEVPIERFREWDGEFGATIGYYARGFWEPRSFAIAANKEYFENDGYCKAANVSDVQHLYYELCSCSDFDDDECSDQCWCSCTERTPGAFAVTIVMFG